MALQKTVAQPSGVSASYHKIETGVVDFVALKTTVHGASYLDEAARQSGAEPLSRFSTTFDELPTFQGDPRQWAYDLLKQRAEWQGATDV